MAVIDKTTGVSIGILIVTMTVGLYIVTSIERLTHEAEQRNIVQEMALVAWVEVVQAKHPEWDLPDLVFKEIH